MKNQKYIDTIRKYEKEGYTYFGLRVGPTIKVGGYCRLSLDWDPESRSLTSKLSGTSATVITNDEIKYCDDEELDELLESAIKENKVYFENHDFRSNDQEWNQYIVAGFDAEAGLDDNEIIINTSRALDSDRRRGAKVIAVID